MKKKSVKWIAMGFNCDKELYQKIMDIVNEEPGDTFSRVVREALKQYVKNRKNDVRARRETKNGFGK